MPAYVVIVLGLLGAYVVGSIDFAVIVARMHGVDIHTEGSGNPGVSNVLRTVGRGPAAVVFIGDTLKGTVGAALGWFAAFYAFGAVEVSGPWVWAAGFFAVLGHCYPIFHKFKGGKGVATGAGVLLFAASLVAIITLTIWGIVVWITRTASIASMIIVVITVPLLIWQDVPPESLIWAAAILLLIIWRHKGNIGRMIKGTEEKVPT